MRVMGAGIADLFMRPYNFKASSTPPSYPAGGPCWWLVVWPAARPGTPSRRRPLCRRGLAAQQDPAAGRAGSDPGPSCIIARGGASAGGLPAPLWACPSRSPPPRSCFCKSCLQVAPANWRASPPAASPWLSPAALLPTTAPQVWAVPTTMMQCDWLGERVATVDVDRAIANVRAPALNAARRALLGSLASIRFARAALGVAPSPATRAARPLRVAAR